MDYKRNIKLISNFAAYEIGLLSYEDACANAKGYYVISDEFITKLKEYYEIEYIF